MLRRVVPEVIEDALFRLPEAADADALAFEAAQRLDVLEDRPADRTVEVVTAF
jgi:hypothetical protein